MADVTSTGMRDGAEEGRLPGVMEGNIDGPCMGIDEGNSVGSRDGRLEGDTTGSPVGERLGEVDGNSSSQGEGLLDTLRDGALDAYCTGKRDGKLEVTWMEPLVGGVDGATEATCRGDVDDISGADDTVDVGTLEGNNEGLPKLFNDGNPDTTPSYVGAPDGNVDETCSTNAGVSVASPDGADVTFESLDGFVDTVVAGTSSMSILGDDDDSATGPGRSASDTILLAIGINVCGSTGERLGSMLDS